MSEPKPTILLADDDPRFRKAVAIRLAHAGYDVIEAEDGTTAVEMAKEHASSIRLLVLDVHMPGANGLGALEMMDADPVLNMLPVIYVSGDTADSLKVETIKRGAMGLMHKPMDMGEFLDAVDLLAA